MSAMPFLRLPALIDRLDTLSVTWLNPHAPPDTPLRDLLADARSTWPASWPDPRTSRLPPATPDPASAAAPVVTPAQPVLLAPLPYGKKPQVTTELFHQLVDAACEADRLGTTAVLVSIPTTRSGPHPAAAQIVEQIAAAYTDAGFPLRPGGDATDHAAGHHPGRETDPVDPAAHFVVRACATPYTRRAIDLPDLLTAAVADSLSTTRVLLTGGLAAGDHLKRLSTIAALSRLHDPHDPFREPPPAAKRPPAGTDALWATAFTTELTGAANPDTDRDHYTAQLSHRIGPLWRALRAAQLTGTRGGSAAVEPLRIHTSHPRGQPVTVPLFGAPIISAATRTLVAAAALAGPITLAIDDLTPRWCYRAYPADDARAAYRTLAAEHHGTATFITDQADLADHIDHALAVLTSADLHRAVGPRHRRTRGPITGYDAIHLAVMAACCTTRTPDTAPTTAQTTAPATVPAPPATLAVRSANAAHLRALTPLLGTPRLLTCTGTPTTAGTGGTRQLDGELRVPMHWITPHTGAVL